MEQKTVDQLERKIEAAIADVMKKQETKGLPLQPSRHTVHLMAKAAVTVYEAALANQHAGD